MNDDPPTKPRRMLALDGVVHISGECCRQNSFCRACGARMHMTGGYLGPVYACENCDDGWKPVPDGVEAGDLE